MKTITHEGQEYILKSEVDNIVSSRISKISESRRALQAELDTIKEQNIAMQEKSKNFDALHSQIATLQDELKNSNQKYARHSAIAGHGITNPEVRDLIEWQYSKAMDNTAKKDRVTMNEWLNGFQKEGAEIPHILQPYIGTQNTQAPQAESHTEQRPQSAPLQHASIPKSNNGVQSTSEQSTSRDMMQKAGTDFEYYQKNRAKIKEMYYARKGRAL